MCGAAPGVANASPNQPPATDPSWLPLREGDAMCSVIAHEIVETVSVRLACVHECYVFSRVVDFIESAVTNTIYRNLLVHVL